MKWTNAASGLLLCAACGSSGAGGSGPSSAPPASCSAEPTHQGEGTYYTFADGTGNCSFDATPNDLMIGAMNAADYAHASACGACARIAGPLGTQTVRIVDQCPECPKGNIDLSPQAFDQIAQRSAGRVPISWQYVPCATQGPLVYRFKEGSNQWWTAVQLRNHKNRVAKLEYERNGAFLEVHREDYNYFVDPHGMGPGPYTFRVTDVYADSIVDSAIAHEEATEVPGGEQFPNCSN